MTKAQKSICDSVFYDYDNLTSITIPDCVISIGEYAFTDCSALTAVVIPDSVTEIGAYAFKGCELLKDVTFGASVESIGDGAFKNCAALETIALPDSVVKIGNEAFYGTAWFTAQPEGLVYIGKVAYKFTGDMDPDTSIEITDGTKGISDFAFDARRNLVAVTIPDTVEYIGDAAFRNTGIKALGLPEGLKEINYMVCYSCDELTEINVPKSVTGIAYDTIASCDALAAVNFDKGSKAYVGSGNFYDCPLLKELTIPYGVGSPTGCVPDGTSLKCFEDTIWHKYALENGIDFELLTGIIVKDNTFNIDGELLWGAKEDSSFDSIVAGLGDAQYKLFDAAGEEITDTAAAAFTGAAIKLYKDGNAVDTIYVVIPGDVDGIAGIETDDARKVLRASVGLDNLAGAFAAAADVVDDGDKPISTDDARKILRASVGLDVI